MSQSDAASRKEPSGPPTTLFIQPVLRLLVIPLLVYSIWLMEIFLLEGNVRLFSRPDSAGLVIYTLVACVLIGSVVPLFLIRRSFLSGAVNLFQIGFRSARRTILICTVTLAICSVPVVLFSPPGMDSQSFFRVFLLLLPTGIASVMVCWVLVGTHVQALVRGSGAPASICVGVVVTSILFGIVPIVQTPGVLPQEMTLWNIGSGIIAALFFFSLRDVYATSIVVTVLRVLPMTAGTGTGYPGYAMTPILLSAAISLGTLAGIHWYLSRNFATIAVPEMQRT